jgi:integrase
VSLADLHATEDGGTAGRSVVVVPTVAEYLPQVIAAAGPGAARTYGSYWTRIATAWGERPVDAIAASDIEALQRQAIVLARRRRISRGGRHAGEHVIAAARAVFNRAVADGLIEAAANPARRVPKPRRLPSTRRALTPDELDAINVAARARGNDVVLDALLLRLHTETACRRGGALGLRVMDLDVDRGLVRLREKGGTLRWQPVTLHLAQRPAEHADARGAVLPTDTLLRYRDGRALTSRRYDHLWHRLGQQLPWGAAQGISTHWLRHTTLT